MSKAKEKQIWKNNWNPDKPYTREKYKACVGPGWSALIDEILDIIPSNAEIYQIKEKFGELRFYYKGDKQKEVQVICDKSCRICEECGEPGQKRTKDYWVRTVCDKCLEHWDDYAEKKREDLRKKIAKSKGQYL